MKNKKLTILLPTLFLALSAASCTIKRPSQPSDSQPESTQPGTSSEETIAVTSVTLNKSALELEVGDDETLQHEVLPANASNTQVTWESNHPEFATVSNRGKVTAVAEGTATITVKSVADPTKFANCVVTVKPVDMHGRTETDPLTIAEAIAKTEALEDNGISDKEYYIRGVVTKIQSAYSSQYGNITLEFQDGTKTFVGYRLTVTEAIANTINTNSDVLFKGYLTKYVKGTTVTLETVNNNDHKGEIISSTGGDTKKTGHGYELDDPYTPDEALAFAKTLANGVIESDVAYIKGVVAEVTEPWSDYKNLTFKYVTSGEEDFIAYRVSMVTEGEKAIDPASIIPGETVTIKGQIMHYHKDAEGENPAKDAYETNAGGEVLKVEHVETDTPAESIALDVTSLNLVKARNKKLNVVWTPADAKQTEVIWSSSDTDVATVEDGTVTAVAEGNAVITAKTLKPGKTDEYFEATCQVKVEDHVNYGTLDNPLNIADAIKAIDLDADLGKTEQDIYVKGIVESSTYSSSYKNWVVWLQSDDGQTAEAFELYNCVMDSSITADYKAADALRGLEVICTGQAKKYGKTYEITNYKTGEKDEQDKDIYSYPVIKAVRTLEASEKVATTSIKIEGSGKVFKGKTLKLSTRLFPANNLGETVTWKSSNEELATVAAGVVTGVAKGNVKITASISETIKAEKDVEVAELDPEALPAEGLLINCAALGSKLSSYANSKNQSVKIGNFEATIDPNSQGVACKNGYAYSSTGALGIDCMQSKNDAGKVWMSIDTPIVAAAKVKVVWYQTTETRTQAQGMRFKFGETTIQLPAEGVTGTDTGKLDGTNHIYKFEYEYALTGFPANGNLSILCGSGAIYMESILITAPAE